MRLFELNRITGDRPYLQCAVRRRLRIGDLQALHAKQHRRRILEYDARGSLMISDPVVRPKIVEAAGSLRHAARTSDHPEQARRQAPGTFSNTPRSLIIIRQ
jgi:hypothetical protein